MKQKIIKFLKNKVKTLKKINNCFKSKQNCLSLIKQFEEDFKSIRKKINEKLSVKYENFKTSSYSSKFVVVLFSIMVAEMIIMFPFYLKNTHNIKNNNNKKEFVLVINPNVNNKISFQEVIKKEKKFIKNISIVQADKEKFSIVFEMDKKFLKSENYYSLILKESDFYVKFLQKSISGFLDVKHTVFYDIFKQTPPKTIILFKNIDLSSFYINYEKILLNNSVAYKFFPFDEENQLKNKAFKKSFPFNSFISENLIRVGLIWILLFLLEKQGLLGNKEKYSILQPDKIKNDLSDLIGMEDIKKEILLLSDLIKNREKYKEFGIDRTFNYLFSGPPGTGKTQIAGALAKILDAPMVVGTGNVETGFINGGVSVIKELFTQATKLAENNKHKMAIIFLDEAQTLLVKRGQSREKWADDSANELLAQLDGVHSTKNVDIVFIAASNFDDKNHQFDEAMMRRFKKKLFFRLPNFEERVDILKYYISKIDKNLIDNELDLKYIADIISNTSPAILETIVQESSLIALNSKEQKINTSIMEKAFERITVGQTDRKTTEKQELQRDIISKHELGHFICEMQNCLNRKYILEGKTIYLNKDNISDNVEYLKKEMHVLKISVESIAQVNALGYVLNKSEEVNLKSKKHLIEDIIALYGGLASEEHFAIDKEDITVGSYNDIEKISRLFNVMINELGMFTNYKVNFNLIDNIDVKKDNSILIKEKSEEFYQISSSYILEYEELILFLNKHLLEKYVLTINEILDLIKQFYEDNKNKDIL